MYHDSLALAEAVDLGDIRHARTPNDPVVVHMDRHPCAPGKPRKEQHRIGRADLLAATFETFERSIRDQLTRVLGGGGFDPAARHRRHHRQSMAARLRVHLQQPLRAAGLGLHVERRPPVREGAPAVRTHHHREFGCGGQPAHRRGLSGGEPRRRRSARTTRVSVPASEARNRAHVARVMSTLRPPRVRPRTRKGYENRWRVCNS